MGLYVAVVIDPDADIGDLAQVLADARLGNAAMIGHLHAVAATSHEPSSILMSRVLFSASHSGDFLNQSDIQQLAKELYGWDVADMDAVTFKQTMSALAEVAMRRGAAMLFC